MKWIETTAKVLFALFGTLYTQLWFSYSLGRPLSYISILWIAIILILFLYEHGSIIWMAMFWFLAYEYVSSSPFGYILISGVAATCVVYVLYKEVFTNRSLYSAIALLSIGLLTYRTLYLFLFSIYALQSNEIQTPFLHFFVIFLYEWGMSVIALTGSFLALRVVSQQLKKQRIEESWFKKLGS